MPIDPVADAAARLLFAKFGLSGRDSAGNSTLGSYIVTKGPDGQARVAHRIPRPDPLDDTGPSTYEMNGERRRMVNEYAEVLTAAGWAVEKHGSHTSRPYLLATRPA